MEETQKDSMTIGTPATVQIKIYFDDFMSEEAGQKIAKAIQRWKTATVISGKAK